MADCARPAIARGYCKMHWKRWSKTGDPTVIRPYGRKYPPLAERFWAKVAKAGPDDCWLWQGTLTDGYGMMKAGEQGKGAHRIAWELTHGPIPSGQEVCHSCDVRYPAGDTSNRRCVNPAHLHLGTKRRNSDEMVEKGRQAVGERNHNTVLAVADIPIIRSLAAHGVPIKRIVATFGVSRGTIRAVVERKTWKHVP